MDIGYDISKLTMCAKVLYDKDVIDKNRENRELKERIKQLEDAVICLEIPKILFNNYEEWLKVKNKLCHKIKGLIISYSSVRHWVDGNHEYRYGFGMTIRDELFAITNNDKWSCRIGFELFDEIQSYFIVFCGLLHIDTNDSTPIRPSWILTSIYDSIILRWGLSGGIFDLLPNIRCDLCEGMTELYDKQEYPDDDAEGGPYTWLCIDCEEKSWSESGKN